MISRLDELLIAFFHDNLSEEEEAELNLMIDSNQQAREKFERVVEDKKLAAEDAKCPIEEPKTSMKTRIGAGILLAIILFGFVGMFWIELEAPLVEVVEGKALRDGEAVMAMRDPAKIEITTPSMIHIRGETEVRSESATLDIKNRRHLGEVTLLKGSIDVSRTPSSHDAVFVVGEMEFMLLESGSSLGLLIEDENVYATKPQGTIQYTNAGLGKAMLRIDKDLFTFGGESVATFTYSKEAGSIKLKVEKGEVSSQIGKAHQTYAEGDHEIPAQP